MKKLFFVLLAVLFVNDIFLPAQLRAQTTIIYTDLQTSTTVYNTTGNPLTFSIAAGSATLSGSISGTGGLTKSGAGSLTLDAYNTYTGPTIVSAGTLRLGAYTALGSSGGITFTGGTLQYGTSSSDYSDRFINSTGAIAIDTDGRNVAFSSSLADSNSGGLTKSGAGTLTLANANAYTGTTRLNAGTLRVGSSASSLGTNSGPIIFAGGTLQYGFGAYTDYSARIINSTGAIAIDTGGNNVTFSSSLADSNSGGLTKSGAGTLRLNGTNAYTGTTRLDAGILRLDSASALGGSNVVTFAGGTLEYTTGSTPDYSYRIRNSTGAIAIDAGLGLSFGDALASSNTGGFTKSGLGTLILASDNYYTGNTTLNAGILEIGVSSFGSTYSTDSIIFAGGTLRYRANNSNDYSARIRNSTSTIVIDTNGYDATFASALSATNTGGLTKSGAGTLTLSGNNAYTGITRLNAGTLRVGGYSVLGNSGGITFTGGTLQYGTSSFTDYSARIIDSTGAIAIDTDGNNVTFSSPLADSNSGGLIKSGAGTLTLANANAYTGATRLNAGTLRVGPSATSLGTDSGDITFAGGTLQYASSPYTDHSARIKNSTGAIAIDTNGVSVSVSFDNGLDSSNTGGLTKSGTGTLSLDGTNAYTGPVLLKAGILSLDSASALPSSGAITFAGGSLQYNTGLADYSSRIINSTGAIAIDTDFSATFASALDNSNTGGLTKSGLGTLTLAGTNAYQGNTTLNAGILEVGLSSLGSTSSIYNIVFAGGTLRYSANNSDDYSARIKNSPGVIALDTNSQNVSFASSLDASNTGGLTKSGAGTLTLSGTNAYAGTTTIKGGTLSVSHDNQLGSLTPTLGGITLNNATLQTTTGITSARGVTITDGTTNSIEVNYGQTTTLSGGLTGGGNLNKTGYGALVLSGPTLHSGNTFLADGSLNLNPSADLTYAGNFTGFGFGLTKSGSNTLTLTSENSVAYYFPLYLDGGVLSVSNANQLPRPSMEITFNGGALRTTTGITISTPLTFNSGGNAIDVSAGQTTTLTGSLNLGGGTFTKAGAGTLAIANNSLWFIPLFLQAGTLDIYSNNYSYLYYPLTGPGALVKSGPGILTVEGNLSGFSGSVSVTAGTLNLDPSAGYTTALSLTGAGQLTKSGTTTVTLTGDLSGFSGPTSLDAGILDFNPSANLTFASALSGPGTLKKSGANALTLTGDLSAFSGTTAIAAGILNFAPGADYSTATTLTGAGNLTKSGTTTLTLTGDLSGFSGSTLISDGALAFNPTTDVTYANTISGAGALIKAGANSFTLTGNLSSFSGPIIISAGSLALSSSSDRILANAFSGSGALVKSGSNTLTLTGDLSGFSGITTISTGTLNFNPSAALTYASAITGAGALNKSGLNLLTLTGNLSGFTGSTVIDAGVLNFGSSANFTYAGAITGAGALTKSGSGTLTLTGTNTYSGGTTISAGMLSVSHDNQLGSLTPTLGGITLNNATLQTTTGITSARGVTITDGTTNSIEVNYGQTTTLSGGLTGGGNLNKTGNGALVLSGPTLHSGNTFLADGSLNLNPSADLTYAGNFTGFGFGLTKSGSNTLTLTSENSVAYYFPLYLNGGVLSVSDANQLPRPSMEITFNGGALRTTTGITISTPLTFNSGGNAIDVSAGQTTTLTGSLNLSGGTFTKAGAGTLAIANNSLWFIPLFLQAGTLDIYSNNYSYLYYPLTGPGALVKSGPGILTVEGNLSGFSGSVSVTAGTLNLDPSAGYTTALSLTGAGQLTKSGTTTVTLTGDLSGFSGTTTLAGGILGLGSSSALANSGDVIFAGGTLQHAAGAVPDYSARIVNSTGAIAIDTNGYDVTFASSLASSNTGGFTKSGLGKLILSGTNAYIGTTRLTAGTLSLSSISALPTSGDITFAGGTLQHAVSGVPDYSARIKNSTGAIAIDTGGINLSFDTPLDASNTGGLTKSGVGRLTLSATNAYTGTTRLNAGTLSLGSSSALASSGDVTFAGGILQHAADAIPDYSARIKNSTGAIAINTNGYDVTFASSLASSNTGGLTKSGAGSLTLSATNAYTGTTRLNAGTLSLSSSSALASSGDVTFTGGTLQHAADAIPDYSARIKSSTGAIALDTNGYDVTFASSLASSNTGGLTKSGAGILTLSGTNTYTGNTTINDGTLSVSNDNQLGSLTPAPGSLTLNGGTLLTAASISSTRNVTLSNGTTNTIEVTTGNATILSGAFTGSGNLTKTGTGTLTLSGTSLYSGKTTITDGLLNFNHATDFTYAGNFAGSGAFTKSGTTTLTLTGDLSGLTGTTAIAGGRINFSPTADYTAATTLTGVGALTKSGATTLTLTGANTYTGGTTLTAGILNAGSATALGPTGTISFGGGTLQFSAANAADYSGRFSTAAGQQYRLDTNGRDVTLATGLTSSGATLTKSGTGMLTLTGGSNFIGTTTIEAGTLRIGSGGATGSLNSTGGIVDNGTLIFDRTGTINYNGVISGTGTLIKNASGALNLIGANGNSTFTGGLTVNAGTLTLGNSGNMLADILAVTVTGGTFKLGTANETIGSLAGTGGVVDLFNTAGRTLTAGGNNTSTSFAGVIQGSDGALTKNGTGMLTLTGANTYSGTTTVAAGTLQAGAADVFSAASAVDLADISGTTLDLNNFNQSIAALTGGGANGGNISLGSATLTVGSNNASTTYAGSISGTGGLTKTGTGALTLTNASTYNGATSVSGGTLRIVGSPTLTAPTGTLLFLDATRGVTTNGAGAVTAWADQSGHGYAVTGLAAGTSVLANGARALVFDASSAFTTNAPANGTAYTFLALAQPAGSGGPYTLLGSTTGNPQFRLDGGRLQLVAQSVELIGESSGTAPAGTPVLLGATLANNAQSYYLGGLSSGSSATAYTPGGNGTFYVGATDAGTERFSGTLSALLVFDYVLTPSQIASVNDYLTWRFSENYTTSENFLPTGTALQLTSSTAAVEFNTIRQTVGSLAGVAGSTISLIDSRLTAGGDNTSTTFAGALTSDGSFTKAGSGTLTFSGANTHSGTTTVADGTLRAGAQNTFSANSGVDLANISGATLDLNNFNQTIAALSGGGANGGNISLGSATLTVGLNNASTTYAGVISGTGGLTKSGTGTLTLSAANAYTGRTTLNAGTLSLGANNAFGSSGDITFAGGVLQYATSSPLDYIARIKNSTGAIAIDTNGNDLVFGSSLAASNTGGLTKSGTGTLTLATANAYRGATRLNAGTLSVSHDNQLGSVTPTLSPLTFSGGTLRTTTGITSARAITFGAATTSTISVSAGQTTTLSGGFTGSGNLLKGGAGNLTFSGSTLPSGNIGIANGNLIFDLASDLTYGGNFMQGYILGESGIAYFTKSGPGTLTLTGSYNNSAAINRLVGGVISVSSDSPLGSRPLEFDGGTLRTTTGFTFGTSLVSIFPGGGTLDVPTGQTTTLNASISSSSGGTLTKAGTGTLRFTSYAAFPLLIQAGTFNFDPDGAQSFVGSISGSGALLKSGPNRLDVFADLSAFTGPITISAGTLAFSDNLSASTSPVTLNGGTLLTASGGTLTRAITLGAATTSTVSVSADQTTTLSGGFTGSGRLIKGGAGNLTFSGSTLPSGDISIANGGLIFDLANDLTYGGRFFPSSNPADSGIATFTKSGAGTLTLTNDSNSITGVTRFVGGVISVSDARQLGSRSLQFDGGTLRTTTGVTFDSGSIGFSPGGGTIDVSAGQTTTLKSPVFVHADATVTKAGTGTLRLDSSSALLFPLVIQAGTFDFVPAYEGQQFSGRISGSGAFTKSGSSRLALLGDLSAFTGPIAINAGTLAFSDNLTAFTGSLTITGGTLELAPSTALTYTNNLTGAGVLSKLDIGLLTLTGANAYTGGTTLASGTLNLGSTGAIGSAGVISFGGGTLQFSAANTTDYSGRFSTAAGQQYRLNTNGQAVTLATALTSTGGALTKSGTGTLTLAGNSTFTGGLTVNYGTLLLGNSGNLLADTLAVTVNDGTFKLGTANETIGSLAGTGGVVELYNTAGRTLTVGGNNSSTFFAGIIQGSGGALIKEGTGTLTLAGTNTYTGTTLLKAGFLRLGSPAALAGSGDISFAGGTLQFSAANAIDYSGRFSTAAGQQYRLDTNGRDVALATGLTSAGANLVKSGAGTLALAGANTYTGGTLVAGGILTFAQRVAFANATPANWTTANLVVQSGATAAFNVGGAGEFTATDLATITTLGTSSGGFLAGSYVGFDTTNAGGLFAYNGNLTDLDGGLSALGLVKFGTGTLLLGGNNSYSGNTFVNAGTLRINGNNAFSPNTTIQVASGAIFDANGFTQAFADLTGDGGVNLGVGTITIVPTGTSIYSGQLSGSGKLTMRGLGTQILAGENIFTGDTTVETGTLQIGDGGTGGSLAGNIINHAALVYNRSDAFTQGGVISGTGSLTKLGAGALTLTGDLTYSGPTLVSTGTLAMGGGNVVLTGSVTIDGASAVLDLGANRSGSVGSLTLANGGQIVGSGTSALSTSVFNLQNGSVSAILSGAGTLNKTTAETVTLFSANTYTGATTISGGTLVLAADNRLAASTQVYLTNGATLDPDENVQTIAGLGSVLNKTVGNISEGTITTTGEIFLQSGTFANTFTGESLTARVWIGGDSAATVTLNGRNDRVYASDHNQVIIGYTASPAYGAAGTVRLGGVDALAAASENVHLIAGTLDLNGQINVRAKSINLSTTDSILINGQAAQAASFNGEIGLTGLGQIGGAGALSLGGVVSGGGGLTKIGTGTLTLTGAGPNTYSGTTTVADGTLRAGAADVFSPASAVDLANISGATLDLNNFKQSIAGLVGGGAAGGNISLGSATLTVGTNDASTTYAGIISGTGGLTKTGTGTLTLAGVSTYTGITTINQGTLEFGNGLDLNLASAMALGAGGKLRSNGAGNTTFAGSISGTGELQKMGAGTLTLTGTSSHSGAITVSGGSLVVNGSLTHSNVSVGSGATLGGSGTFGGLVTLGSAAHLAPGNSPGTLTFNSGLTLNDGTVLDLQLGAISDRIAVTGGILTGSASAGGITLNLSDSGGFAATTYTLFDFSGAALSGFDVSDFRLGTTVAGYNYAFNLTGGSFELVTTIQAVPEPSTYATLATGLTMLGVAAWRRRRR